MKKIIKPVYYCDYCKKHGLSSFAITIHESKCMSNPQNNRACMDCIFFEEIEIPYTVEYQTGIDEFNLIDKTTTGFKCVKLNKNIYHVKAEIRELPKKWPETFEKQEPMPKECSHQKTNAEYLDEFGYDW